MSRNKLNLKFSFRCCRAEFFMRNGQLRKRTELLGWSRTRRRSKSRFQFWDSGSVWTRFVILLWKSFSRYLLWIFKQKLSELRTCGTNDGSCFVAIFQHTAITVRRIISRPRTGFRQYVRSSWLWPAENLHRQWVRRWTTVDGRFVYKPLSEVNVLYESILNPQNLESIRSTSCRR